MDILYIVKNEVTIYVYLLFANRSKSPSVVGTLSTRFIRKVFGSIKTSQIDPQSKRPEVKLGASLDDIVPVHSGPIGRLYDGGARTANR